MTFRKGLRGVKSSYTNFPNNNDDFIYKFSHIFQRRCWKGLWSEKTLNSIETDKEWMTTYKLVLTIPWLLFTIMGKHAVVTVLLFNKNIRVLLKNDSIPIIYKLKEIHIRIYLKFKPLTSWKKKSLTCTTWRRWMRLAMNTLWCR